MKILLQILIILSFNLIGDTIASILPFTFPGSIIGLLLLFFALLFKLIKIEHLNELSVWLQKNMAFFFVPVSVGVMKYFDIIKASWLEIIILLLLPILVSFSLVALIAQRGVKDD